MSAAWPPERVARARSLWLKGWKGEEIAADLACGLTGGAVRAKMHRLGVMSAPERPKPLHGGHTPEVLAKMRAARWAGHEPKRPAPVPVVYADDSAIIAVALAEGRVTRLPPGSAAGLTGIERLFWSARPEGSSVRDQQARGLAAL